MSFVFDRVVTSIVTLIIVLFATPAHSQQANIELGKRIANTGNKMHLTVIGGGFLELSDEDGNCYYVQSCELQINEFGKLVVADKWNVGELTFAPVISVPQDANEIIINMSGVVCVLFKDPEIRIETLATLSAYCFNSKDSCFQYRPGLYKAKEGAVSTTYGFGSDSGQIILQGWRDVTDEQTKQKAYTNK